MAAVWITAVLDDAKMRIAGQTQIVGSLDHYVDAVVTWAGVTAQAADPMDGATGPSLVTPTGTDLERLDALREAHGKQFINDAQSEALDIVDEHRAAVWILARRLWGNGPWTGEIKLALAPSGAQA